MSAGNSDDALLARLNALRPSIVSMSKSPMQDKEHDDLSAAGGDAGADHLGATPHNDEDDKLLDELLQDVGLQGNWDLSRHETGDVQKLAADAHLALAAMRRDQQASRELRPTEVRLGTSEAANSDAEVAKPSEDEEAQEIIAKVLAELELDRHGAQAAILEEDDATGRIARSAETTAPEDSGSTLLELPSAPSDLPQGARDEVVDAQDALAARFSGLSLPGAPSFSPNKKPPKVSGSNLPIYTDDQMETWCVICNDDATVRCIGCDGDLYCRSCWAEGHTGVDAGMEEKTHRCVNYRPPRL